MTVCSVKVHDTNNLQGTGSVITVDHEVEVERIEWSDDGQLLAVCGKSGAVSLYLTQISSISAIFGNRIAVLNGLVDVALYNYSVEKVKH